MSTNTHYDVLIVGSGFGGSVSALRLTEKGYRVGVIEAGRRFADDEFAKSSWDAKRYLWAPKLGLKGIQRIHVLPHVVVLAGSGVGGGSLVYANTLYEPKSEAFYDDQQWAHITDWRSELAPHYAQAKRMFGVVPNPTMTAADHLMKKVAEDMGVGDSFGMAPLGVFFGRDGAKEPGVEVEDPYFGGAGPKRTGCTECAACITGCRVGAKNTLVKNYLYLAEQAGTTVHPETTVTDVRPLSTGGYEISVVRTGAWFAKRTTATFTADQVIFAAGTWGTQQLLHRLKAGSLPQISDRLGHLTRTNSEALVGVTTKMRNRKKHDFTHGVTITSSIHPDEHTHIEPNRYPKGSNAMGLMATVMTNGGGRWPRWITWIGQVLRHPGQLASLYFGIRHWSERSIIALVMQTHDNSLTLRPKKTLFGGMKVTSTQGHGEPNPTWIPIANETMRRAAKEIDGYPLGSVSEIADVPMTAHFLGGCAIGDSAETGVIDPYQRMYGHAGLHVLDGSAISANIGVNPSLTITAQAERAMSFWPNLGQADQRPGLGAAYRQLAPVVPQSPSVPSDAPGALRLPIVEIRSGSASLGGAR